MQQVVSHGAPSPKLSKTLEILIDHFSMLHITFFCLFKYLFILTVEWATCLCYADAKQLWSMFLMDFGEDIIIDEILIVCLYVWQFECVIQFF